MKMFFFPFCYLSLNYRKRITNCDELFIFHPGSDFWYLESILTRPFTVKYKYFYFSTEYHEYAFEIVNLKCFLLTIKCMCMCVCICMFYVCVCAHAYMCVIIIKKKEVTKLRVWGGWGRS